VPFLFREQFAHQIPRLEFSAFLANMCSTAQTLAASAAIISATKHARHRTKTPVKQGSIVPGHLPVKTSHPTAAPQIQGEVSSGSIAAQTGIARKQFALRWMRSAYTNFSVTEISFSHSKKEKHDEPI
jgi:hypothetical protein